MKLTGIATITKWQQQEDGTLVEVESRVEHNVITKRTFDSILSSSPSTVFTNALRLAGSTSTAAVNFEALNLTTVISVSQLLSFVQQPRVGNTAGCLYTFRFVPPTATRTFNTIAIVSGAEINETAAISRPNFTQLLLGAPITQLSTEIVDVSYQITVNWTDTSVPSNIRLYIERLLGFTSDSNITISTAGGLGRRSYASGAPLTGFSNYYNPQSVNKFGGLNSTAALDVAYVSSAVASSQVIPYTDGYGADISWGLYFNNQVNSAALPGAKTLGTCYRGIAFYDTAAISDTTVATYNSEGTVVSQLPITKTSNLSNVFSHAAAAVAPMFDVNFLANSTWRPNISEAVSATDALPLHYILRVTTAGGIGVGTYKLYTTAMAGWNNNTFAPKGQLHHSFNGTSAIVNELDSSFIFNNRWVYDWSYTQSSYKFVTYKRKAGVAILDLQDDSLTEFKKYSLASNPTLGSLINDVAVNPAANLIYVATSSGLFSIDTVTDTVTLLNSTPCLSVVVGNAGVVYAVFRTGAGVGRLSSSTGGFAVALSTGAAVINWDNIWRLFIDAQSTTDNLMIYEGSCPKHTTLATTASVPANVAINKYKIHWWNTTSNFISTRQITITPSTTLSRYFEHELLVLPNNRCVSVTNGLWIYPGDRRDSAVVANTANLYSFFNADITGGIPLEVKYDLTGFRLAGWRPNESALTLLSNAGSSAVLSDSGEYAFGFHGVASIHSINNRDGWLCSVHVGKPTPAATSYQLRLIFGMQLGELTNSATATITTPTRTSTNFVNLSFNEAGGTVTTDLATTNGLYYNAQDTNVSQQIFNANCNFATIGDKKIIFLAQPNFGGQIGANVEAYPANVTNIYQAKNLPGVSNSGGIGYVDTLRVPSNDFADFWLQAWEWNGTTWIKDDDNNGPGKAIHVTTEDLIEGVRISWTDLAPGSSQNLIVGQYYNFCRITDPNQILIETTTPNFSSASYTFLRQINNNNIGGTVPAVGPFRVYAQQAPLGSTPVSTFLGVLPFAQNNYVATINGLPVNVVVNTSTTPPAGTIHVTSPTAGEFYFNSGAAGLPFTIQYNWASKYHSTEVL